MNSTQEQQLLDESMVDDETVHEGTTAAIAAATMNESSETTDDHLLNSLQSSMMLRKNLEQEFQVTVSEKIEYFETETKKNVFDSAAMPPPKSGVQEVESTTLHHQQQCPRFQVFLRVRPSTDDTNTIDILNATTVRTNPPRSSYAALPKEFAYDTVLAPSLTQKQVYDQTAAPLLSRLFQGSSVLLFCYGVTNAGKTFTLHGEGSRISGSTAAAAADTSPEASWGVLPRVLHDAYIRVKSCPPTASKEMHVTFFELYQERFYDLLQEDNAHNNSNNNSIHRRKALRLREDKLHGQAFVEGLTTHKVESLGQALYWMKTAKKNRQTATNELNRTSSRSHCVCQLIIKDMTTQETTSFWVVDLAGSERHKRTTSAGLMRHQEAISINKSLMTLMRCLMTLKDGSNSSNNNNNKMPPFRESKLTHLLMPHWSEASNTVTAMVVNVNPAASDYDESQHVLSYATQAKTIQLPVTVSHNNKDDPQQALQKVEYDENGRRKRAAGGGVRSKMGQLLQKLSPKRVGGGLKRKAPAEPKNNRATTTKTAAASYSSTKRFKGAPSSSAATTSCNSTEMQNGATMTAPNNNVKQIAPGTNVKSSRAYKALQLELTVAKTEANFLKAEKQELEEQLESVEDQVRKEMAEEMDKHMRAMRVQYEDIIENLRQQKLNASTVKATPRRRTVEEKIGDLEVQVQECEEEMTRQREEHALELEAVKQEYERKLSEAVKEATAKETAKIRAELAKKQELIDNYSRLLHEEEEEEEIDEEEDRSSEEEESTHEEEDSMEEEENDEKTNRHAAFARYGADESIDGAPSEKSVTDVMDDEDDVENSEDEEDAPESCSPSAIFRNLSQGVKESATKKQELDAHDSRKLQDVEESLAAVKGKLEADSAHEDDKTLEEQRATDQDRESIHLSTVKEKRKNGIADDEPSNVKSVIDFMQCDDDTESTAEGEGSASRRRSTLVHGVDAASAHSVESDEQSVCTDKSNANQVAMIASSKDLEAEVAYDASASETVENHNPGPSVSGNVVPEQVIDKENSTSVDVLSCSPMRTSRPQCSTKSPKLNSGLQPLAPAENKREAISSDSCDESPGSWLTPKKEAKKDRKTGMFLRPRGRAPVGAGGWDERKGKWRLSMA